MIPTLSANRLGLTFQQTLNTLFVLFLSFIKSVGTPPP